MVDRVSMSNDWLVSTPFTALDQRDRLRWSEVSICDVVNHAIVSLPRPSSNAIIKPGCHSHNHRVLYNTSLQCQAPLSALVHLSPVSTTRVDGPC